MDGPQCVREAGIDQQMSRLEGEVGEIEQVCEMFINKLHAVLTPDPPTIEPPMNPNKAAGIDPAPSPVTNHLMGLNNRLRDLTQKMRSAMHRLDC